MNKFEQEALDDIVEQENRHPVFKQYSRELKMKIDYLYRDNHYRMLQECHDYSKEEKQYLALRFGYFYPLKNEMDFPFMCELLKVHPSLIPSLLPLCSNKEEQAGLVKISLDAQDNHVFLINTFPHLLKEYMDKHCTILEKTSHPRIVVFDNGNKGLHVLRNELRDMLDYVAKNEDNEKIYLPLPQKLQKFDRYM